MKQLLAIALAVLPGVFLQGQENGNGTRLVKENLDLPYSAGADSEEEESAPEIIVFYGEQFEGQGVFFCCGTSGICRT